MLPKGRVEEDVLVCGSPLQSGGLFKNERGIDTKIDIPQPL